MYFIYTPSMPFLLPFPPGYQLGSAFDHYVNEAWWGIMSVQKKRGWFTPTYPVVRLDKLRYMYAQRRGRADVHV